MASPAVPRWRTSALFDVLAIVAAWVAFAFWVGHGFGVTAYDALRDMAYAQGIQRGHLGLDPSLSGYAAWYPPGNPLFFAGLSWVTRVPVVRLYVSSLYWLGWFFPVALYLLVRANWGRAVALLSLPTVFLGSYWWFTQVSMPMASVQGVPLGLLALLAWTRTVRGGAHAWIVTGLLLAVATWHHPLCGLVALASVAGHGVLSPLFARGGGAGGPRFRLALHAAGACAVALVLAAPLLAHQLGAFALARTGAGNAAAYHWFSPELHEWRYALHAHAPFVLPLGLAGLWFAARRWRESGWLVAYAAVGLAGEALGYAGHDAGWAVPWVLPHEFQAHEQLALMVAAALAIVRLAELLAERAVSAWRAPVRRAAVFALLAAGVGPALPHASFADGYAMRLDERWQPLLQTAAWVRAHTPLESVFVCTPDAGYDIAGLTGRRCIVLPPGHMNPAADMGARVADVRAMLATADERVFLPLARRYDASYLLVLPEPGTAAAMRMVYRGWPSMTAADRADSSMLIYRIAPPVQ